MSVARGEASFGSEGSVRCLFLSVDLDSWVHCRWASGSENALWPDSFAGYREAYGADRPGADFWESCDWVLTTFDRLGIRCTFFVLSEVASLFPEIIRDIHARGHEIALHGQHHVDNTRYEPEAFRALIQSSRELLEDVIGEAVVGYRAPNLILDSTQLRILDEEGFLYDSSVCPTRQFFGKYGNMTGAPSHPYHPAADDLARPGDLRIVELPHGRFPVLSLPVSTGIMTRMLGSWWPTLGLAGGLRRGYGLYYFHPYETGPRPRPPKESLYIKLFLRNVGGPYRRALERFLGRAGRRARISPGRAVAEGFLRLSPSPQSN